MTYDRPVVLAILKLLKASFGNTFKSYYDDDPIYIGSSNLPSLIVDKQRTINVGRAPTGMIQQQHVINIQAEFDKRTEFGKNPNQLAIKATLERLAEGIDSTTGEYGEQTIAGILQRHFTLNNLVINQDWSIEYGLFPRGRDVLTQGVTFQATFTERRQITRSE